jgi:dipeptidase
MVEYSPTSAFWTFNWVANWAYTRYSYMIKDIQKVQRELELGYIDANSKD